MASPDSYYLSKDMGRERRGPVSRLDVEEAYLTRELGGRSRGVRVK